jgi:hypothetical protein
MQKTQFDQMQLIRPFELVHFDSNCLPALLSPIYKTILDSILRKITPLISNAYVSSHITYLGIQLSENIE